MKTSKVISALLIAVVICASPCESYGQVLHTVAKVAAKKGAKEATKKSTKTLARETVQQVSEKAAKKVGTEAVESAAKRTVKTVLKEGVEDFTGITAAKRLEQLIKSRSASSLNRVGSYQSLDLAEEALENSMKKKAADRISREAMEHAGGKAGSTAAKSVMKKGARFVGKEALDALDDMPGLKKYVSELMGNRKPYLDIDNLSVTKSAHGTHIRFRNTNTSMTINGNMITAKSGSIQHVVDGGKSKMIAGEGDLNVFLDNPLPNMNYKIDNHIHIKTDDFGRTVSIETNSSELYRHMKDNGIEHGSIYKNNRDDLLRQYNSLNPSTDYGHLVRRELGGINEKVNALPMLHATQGSGSRWFELENLEISSCALGNNVKSRMKIKYLPNGKYEIDVEKIINGVSHHPAPFTDLL